MNKARGSTPASARYARMRSHDCDRIHQASLEILERVGVDVHDSQARDLLVKGGARADGVRLRVPEQMVDAALAQAPKRLTLFDRHGKVAIQAAGHRAYFGGGSDCLHVLDHRTGGRRRAVLQDVREAVRLMDGLPEIEFVMSMFLPEDTDPRIYDRYQMEVMLNHTAKPIIFVSPDMEGCVAAVEMCEIVAGGAEAFRKRPFATCYINVTSGLVANAEALRKCMFLAGKGLPLLYIPLNAGGVNSPATTAGCTASMNAGTLLGIVLAQLVREGTPVAVPGWNGGPYNLKTMVGNYVLPDEQGIPTEMGRYYDLPVFGLGGCTDSKVLDQQCGMESSLSLMTSLIHGANIVHDVGFMDSGMQGSLQLQVIANDTIGWLRAATRGIPIDEDTLALDVIEELGPTGDYLGHSHTLAHFREPFYSRLADKGTHSQWVERGATSMEERAAREVDRILESHQPESLPASVQHDLRRVVEREQAWIDSLA